MLAAVDFPDPGSPVKKTVKPGSLHSDEVMRAEHFTANAPLTGQIRADVQATTETDRGFVVDASEIADDGLEEASSYFACRLDDDGDPRSVAANRGEIGIPVECSKILKYAIQLLASAFDEIAFPVSNRLDGGFHDGQILPRRLNRSRVCRSMYIAGKRIAVDIDS